MDKALCAQGFSSVGYKSSRDGSNFKENVFLNMEEFRITLGLYIDEFKLANLPGNINCVPYSGYLLIWTLNINQFHTLLNTLLCKVNTVIEPSSYSES